LVRRSFTRAGENVNVGFNAIIVTALNAASVAKQRFYFRCKIPGFDEHADVGPINEAVTQRIAPNGIIVKTWMLCRFPTINNDLCVGGLAYRALDVLVQVAKPQVADAADLVVIARRLGHTIKRTVANKAVLLSIPLLGLEHGFSRFSGQWRLHHLLLYQELPLANLPSNREAGHDDDGLGRREESVVVETPTATSMTATARRCNST
jgi:hypothetical protein